MSFTKFKHCCMGVTVVLYMVAVLLLYAFIQPKPEEGRALANYMGLGLAVWMVLLIKLVRPAYRVYLRWAQR